MVSRAILLPILTGVAGATIAVVAAYASKRRQKQKLEHKKKGDAHAAGVFEQLPFTKLHGTGNDFVLVDCVSHGDLFPSGFDIPAFARRICHRNFGIGGDGLLVLRPGSAAAGTDAEMVIYNADGSVAGMCGNGLRCLVKFVYDHVLVGKAQLSLQTGAGVKTAIITPGADGTAELISIDMGAPLLRPDLVPVDLRESKEFKPSLSESELRGGPVLNQRLRIGGGRELVFSAVSMGVPHCVVYVDDVKAFPVAEFGPLIENLPVVSRDRVIQRTWERGVGAETFSCGTGACAVCVVGVLTGRTNERLQVQITGGELQIAFEPSKALPAAARGEGQPRFSAEQLATVRVQMTGPAVEVFRGKVDLKA